MGMSKFSFDIGLIHEPFIPSRYRDEWAMRHFLHPKLLRKSREVRAQLEDIMKFQKMDIISAGTDFDILRLVDYDPFCKGFGS